MKKSKKLTVFCASVALFLTACSLSTPAFAATQTTQSQEQVDNGFVDHIWYQTVLYGTTERNVYVTVSRGNQAFRGYIQRKYTVPSGHGPTGVFYGGYLYNTKLRNYPTPILNKRVQPLTIDNHLTKDNAL
ncbi:hypothetical protein [uncultured Lactobacillus sp.]|uniref:hypothetical protein n=1 Tax=uncultured Lactobacillus sp. TaxID=153152 RepID=UPI002612A28B|nr:hypothetical protein [uncultured Lactobacillus sp.]